MKLLSFILLSLLFSPLANARVGETKEQCEKRYGKALGNEGEMYFYQKAGLDISVEFNKGVADFIYYLKSQKDKIGQPEKLSDNEVQLLIESNKASGEWEKVKSLSLYTLWHNKQKSLHAKHTKLDRTLTVCSQSYIDRIAKRQKEEEAKKLKGF